jgi:hypothetical protein
MELVYTYVVLLNETTTGILLNTPHFLSKIPYISYQKYTKLYTSMEYRFLRT